MPNLNYYKDKIKEKRGKTLFRDFIKEIASWMPFSFNKNNSTISRFPKSNRINIVSNEEFDKTRDDLTKSGIIYDNSIDFFGNLKNLFLKTKLPSIFHYGENENCDFADVVLYCKNAYLSSIMIGNCENIFYSVLTRTNSTNIFNSLFSVENSNSIYSSSGIISCFNIFYSRYLNNCNNCWFSSNLVGCKECIFCDNLENISYAINNKVYSKDEYKIKKSEILKDKNKFLDYYKKVEKTGKNYASNNVKGSFILESEDLEDCFFAYNSKNARNCFFIGSTGGSENFYDVCPGGGGAMYNSDFYAINGAGNGSSNLYCSSQIGSSSNIFYSYFLENCSYCLGCIGLKNKSYCILNKQYSKEEWEILADKIFSQMESNGTLGDFFPGELNPFYFNDTMAGILGDFTKDEVEKEGYMWRDEEIKVDIPEGSEVIYVTPPARSSLPPHLRGTEGELLLLSNYQGYDSDGNWKINPEILKKVIKDEKGNYYRIVKMEYDFLMKHSFPLPEIHWMDRMKLNFGV